jgi:hypothetical protein
MKSRAYTSELTDLGEATCEASPQLSPALFDNRQALLKRRLRLLITNRSHNSDFLEGHWKAFCEMVVFRTTVETAYEIY